MSQRFIKFIPGTLASHLRKKNIHAFALLSLIAERARREPGHPDGMQVGQCYIGDYEEAGIPTRQRYRTALDLLVRMNLVRIDQTCRTKNRSGSNSTTTSTTYGTIVTLLDTSVWDVNLIGANHLSNHQLTTNKKEQEGIYKETTTMRPSPSKISASVVVSFPEKISLEHKASTQIQKPLASDSQSAKHPKSSSLFSKPTLSSQTVTPSLSTVIFPILERLPLSNENKQALSSKYSETEVIQAVTALKQSKTEIRSVMAWLTTAIQQQFKPADIRSCTEKKVAALQAIYEKNYPGLFIENLKCIPDGCMKVLTKVISRGKTVLTSCSISIKAMLESEYTEYILAVS